MRTCTYLLNEVTKHLQWMFRGRITMRYICRHASDLMYPASEGTSFLANGRELETGLEDIVLELSPSFTSSTLRSPIVVPEVVNAGESKIVAGARIDESSRYLSRVYP